MKKFNKFELSNIKRTAQNLYTFVAKKEKIREQITNLQEEYDRIDKMQEQWEVPIRTMTGGYSTEDLVERQVLGTGKYDANGKEIKTTKYVFRYPETILPPMAAEENTNLQEVANSEAPFESVDEFHGTSSSGPGENLVMEDRPDRAEVVAEPTAAEPVQTESDNLPWE